MGKIRRGGGGGCWRYWGGKGRSGGHARVARSGRWVGVLSRVASDYRREHMHLFFCCVLLLVAVCVRPRTDIRCNNVPGGNTWGGGGGRGIVLQGQQHMCVEGCSDEHVLGPIACIFSQLLFGLNLKSVVLFSLRSSRVPCEDTCNQSRGWRSP